MLSSAIRNRLLAAELPAPIFDTLAPFGQSYPYVLLQYVGGGDENQTPLDTRNELWQVKAVSENPTTAQTLAQGIRAALHHQPLTVHGWAHLWTIHTDPIRLVELVQQERVYHVGGTFRIRLAHHTEG